MKSRKIAVSLHRERKQKRFYFALKRIYSQAWHKIEAQRRYRFTPLGFAFFKGNLRRIIQAHFGTRGRNSLQGRCIGVWGARKRGPRMSDAQVTTA